MSLEAAAWLIGPPTDPHGMVALGGKRLFAAAHIDIGYADKAVTSAPEVNGSKV